jgi:hypothetical protein
LQVEEFGNSVQHKVGISAIFQPRICGVKCVGFNEKNEKAAPNRSKIIIEELPTLLFPQIRLDPISTKF